MGLRWKIALSLAAVALIATFAVGLIGYRSTSARLLDEVDRSIGEATSQMIGRAVNGRVPMPARSLLEVYSVRVLNSDGREIATSFPDGAPIDEGAIAVVGRPRAVDRQTVSVGDELVRVHTIGLVDGALQVSRSLDEVDSVLDDLRQRTLVLVLLVSTAAAMVGWLIAGTVAAPVRRLTRAAEDVGSSGRLDVAVPGTGTDEVGRLGSAFRDMLGALAVSRAEQHRLVQDAGHELRTPLTSLTTNLSVLRRHPNMAPEMRDGILDDLEAEVGELTELVNELVAVASGELDEQPNERLELPAVATEIAERVGRRRSRDVVVQVGTPASVDAPRAALERAVTNLIDNACKFDQSGSTIEVFVDGGSLTVLDRGPGIAPGEEERIFDRFHRSEAARSMPGSGLGLSIVRDVVTRAQGTVVAGSRDGGGAAIGFTLPVSPNWPVADDDGSTGGAPPPMSPPVSPPQSAQSSGPHSPLPVSPPARSGDDA
jgi:two-component system sensor histidine kinase MprB